MDIKNNMKKPFGDLIERNRKLKKQYALFDKDVRSEDKYRVTTPSSLVFNTRKEAEEHIERNGLRDVKILVVYGYSPRVI